MGVAQRLTNAVRCLGIWCFAAVLYLLRRVPWMHRLLPGPLHDALRIWTDPMLAVPLRSFGRRVYVDEPCPLQMPADFAPRAPADPAYALADGDVRRFYERGFLGPFDALTESEAGQLREHVAQLLPQPSDVYGFPTTRDRHLDSQLLSRLIAHPAIVERVAQLMGPDLLVWRSNVFEKPAGAPEITWHQGTTFLMEQIYKPAMEPPDRHEIFEIGVWLAIDGADPSNGCMQVVPGSHLGPLGTIRLTGNKQFLDARFEGDYRIDASDVENLACRAGQFYLFTERLVHGSEPNRSPRPRMSFVARYVKPDCRVYRGETHHLVLTMKRRFPLGRWAAVLVHGKDRVGCNPTIPAEAVEQAEATSSGRPG